jgi:hypothetical protein
MQAYKYNEVNATIWLIKGDHFFFYCDQKLNLTSEFDALDANKLCALKSMQNGYPRTDNVNLVIRALSCESSSAMQL